MKIVQPSELSSNAPISCLIYGQPGVGKTTVAVGAPSPLLIDFDHGLIRIKKEYQCPSVQVSSYEDILELMQSEEIKAYNSIVVDTFGKFIDCMFDYLADKNGKLRNYNGQPTQQGWGQIKTTATKFIKDLLKMNKNIIFVAHDREDKSGDEFFIRPDISGASGKELVKEIDLVGYMSIKGGKRTICFNPSDNFVAKNSLGLEGFINLPPDNSFFTEIIEKIKARREEDNMVRLEYEQLLEEQDSKLATIKEADQLDFLINDLKDAENKVIWGSKMIYWNKIKKLAKEKFNMEYDNANGKFVACDA